MDPNCALLKRPPPAPPAIPPPDVMPPPSPPRPPIPPKELEPKPGSKDGSSSPESGGFSMVCVAVSGPVAAGGAPLEPVSCAHAPVELTSIRPITNTVQAVWLANLCIVLRDNDRVSRLQQEVLVAGFAFDQFFIVHWNFLLRAVLVPQNIDLFGIGKLGEAGAGQRLQEGHVRQQIQCPAVRHLSCNEDALTVHLGDNHGDVWISHKPLELLGNRSRQVHGREAGRLNIGDQR